MNTRAFAATLALVAAFAAGCPAGGRTPRRALPGADRQPMPYAAGTGVVQAVTPAPDRSSPGRGRLGRARRLGEGPGRARRQRVATPAYPHGQRQDSVRRHAEQALRARTARAALRRERDSHAVGALKAARSRSSAAGSRRGSCRGPARPAPTPRAAQRAARIHALGEREVRVVRPQMTRSGAAAISARASGTVSAKPGSSEMR